MSKLIEDKLIDNIGKERYLHSLRVLETATSLAKEYKMDVNKAQTAAILHDCAKFTDRTKLLKMASKFDIIIDNVMNHNIELIHGPLGAKIAELEYGVEDIEVINAIKYHTTGRENMTMLDKIIYISDYIEPRRNFKGVERVRELAFIDIDSSVLLAIEDTIRFLIEKGRVIHLDTINARNDLVIWL